MSKRKKRDDLLLINEKDDQTENELGTDDNLISECKYRGQLDEKGGQLIDWATIYGSDKDNRIACCPLNTRSKHSP